MDTLTFIGHATTQAHQRLLATLDGLDEETLCWRPAPHANAIIEIAWHVARVDDRLGRRRSGLGPEVWSSQAWHRRFGVSEDANLDGGYQFLRAGGVIPTLATIVAYLGAIHADTQERLARLGSDDLDRIPDPTRPQWTIAACFRHMITHKNNHHGQIDLIRGLRQPGWDLPPGTGVRQPG
jgi:uncharacterized damage-inducible protein DinB